MGLLRHLDTDLTMAEHYRNVMLKRLAEDSNWEPE